MDQETNMTNGSHPIALSATPGPSVITFAALSLGIVLLAILAIIILWFRLKIEKMIDGDIGLLGFRRNFMTFSMIVIPIGVIAAVTAAILLVVGSVLSTQNGLNAEGITGRVLLILTVVIFLVVWVSSLVCFAALTYDAHKRFSTTDSFLLDFMRKIGLKHNDEWNVGKKCIFVSVCAAGCVVTPVFMIGVVLLGWSSFELDTIQGNGSNSTVTPGLNTAAVVISSVGIAVQFLMFLTFLMFALLECIWISKKWLMRRKETKDERARLRMSKTLLDEALKRGFVKCRTVVCLLVGVAGAGKTHTKHLLFRWAPPEVRDSTPLAARPVQAIRVRASTRGGRLQEVKPDRLDQILASTVAKGGVPLEDTNLLCCTGRTESIGISSSSKILHTPSNESTSDSKGCFCCNGSDSDQELKLAVKEALDKTTHRIATTAEPQQLLDCDWIYLIDSGGQIEFLEALPAFLQHTSVCLFVTKLSEMLSERPKIEYFENGKPVGEPILCPFTNEQMLMRCVQTIQTQCTHHDGSTDQDSKQSKQDSSTNSGSKQSKQDSSTNQGSKLVMVGTHCDLEDQCSESREEKNERLRSKFCPEFDQSLVFHGLNMKELVFPINANNPGPQDRKVANKITEVIFNVASSLEPRKTPISWFKFEQLIQKLAREYGKRILHWKECSKIARLLHLSAKDLDAVLDYLASFGVIHYYWHLLPDIVFVDPQLLLEKISELVKHHYKLRYTVDPKTAAIGGEWREFRNEGCITLELLKKFPEHYTDIFTPADFLKLLSDRLIVTQFIGINKYFMPCLLRSMESQEVDEYRATSSASRVAPLAIHFSCKLVPHGVFCSLVAFLRSQSRPWSLSLCPEDKTKPLCLTRNCIKFQLPEGAPGSLTLIDAFSHLEVHINAPHDTCVSFCPLIWHTLFEGIQKAAETLKYRQLVPKLAFLCKCKNAQPHLALPADAFDYWTCELNPDTVYDHLTAEHWVWCPEKGPKEEVHFPLKTLSEVDRELPTQETQPKTFSRKHKRVKGPKEEVCLPLETQSGGLQVPTEDVKVVLEEPFGGDEDLPTVLECTRFRGRDRRINIPQEIGTKYYRFGLQLLDDPNGTRVRNLELEYRQNAERINTEILQEWTTGKGKKPVTWKTLTEVLRDIELCALASEIEAVKKL